MKIHAPSASLELLDYFAAHALTGALANSVAPWPDDKTIAFHCYAIAAEMLEQRAKLTDANPLRKMVKAAPSPDDINERGRM